MTFTEDSYDRPVKDAIMGRAKAKNILFQVVRGRYAILEYSILEQSRDALKNGDWHVGFGCQVSAPPSAKKQPA
jgi:hypothetical protein